MIIHIAIKSYAQTNLTTTIVCNIVIIENTALDFDTQDEFDEVPCLWIAAMLSPSKTNEQKTHYEIVF